MRTRIVQDLSGLPTYAFGHRGTVWWGTLGFLVIEGMGFVIAVIVYFYLRSGSGIWPLNGTPPDLLWGTLNTVVFVLSLLPNHWVKKAAEREDLGTVRIGLVVSLLIGLVMLGIRWMELQNLNCRWDENAYGSIVWFIIGLHTLHLITEIGENAVICALMWIGPIEGRRFVDVSENQEYWYFVVAAWLPIYLVVYLVPHWG
jgi:cytochrome c oxidase subunit III